MWENEREKNKRKKERMNICTCYVENGIFLKGSARKDTKLWRADTQEKKVGLRPWSWRGLSHSTHYSSK